MVLATHLTRFAVKLCVHSHPKRGAKRRDLCAHVALVAGPWDNMRVYIAGPLVLLQNCQGCQQACIDAVAYSRKSFIVCTEHIQPANAGHRLVGSLVSWSVGFWSTISII